MIMPKQADIIGRVTSLVYRKSNYRYHSSRSFLDKPELIATNKTRTILFLFPEKPIRQESENVLAYDVPDTELKQIAIPVRIQIVTFWWEGIEKEYVHDFANGMQLFSDRYDRPSVMAIKYKNGKKLIGPRGLI